MIPIFVDELHISFAQAGIFVTAYAIVRCVASLPAGSLTDKWGAVSTISACFLGIGIFGLLATIGNNYYWMLILRMLVSIGVAIIFITAIDAIPKYVPTKDVGKNVGYINGSLNIGIALALFITPIFADSLGWRWTARLYSFSFLFLFIASIPLLKNLPETLQKNSSSVNETAISFVKLLCNPLVMLLALATSLLLRNY